jgi:ABC-type Mn2+/Zn2+ transport system ATPase subunit
VTILMVSHDLHTLERHAKSIGFVNRGLVYQEARLARTNIVEHTPATETARAYQHD